MSEEQKPDTIEAVAKVLSWQCGGDRETARSLALFCIAAHNEELERHPIKIPLSELESVIAIARKREGKHTMDPASEVTMFFVDLGLPIEVIE